VGSTGQRNILTDKTDQALTASMVDVGHALGLKVFAELLTARPSFMVKDLSVDYMRGV
jgi:EAL domain-containing protein (putative c-di-GMP-specific phosphodiesterase class I)